MAKPASKTPNHAFAVAMSDLRERAAKIEILIEAAERAHALQSATLGDHVAARSVALRLLVEAADTASGIFEELQTAVQAMGAADA